VIEDVTPTEFACLLADDSSWQVLDVREPWEFEVSALETAILMPMGDVAERISEIDASRPTAVLCRSGVRSRQVAVFLAENGFKKLINIAGGINAWAHEVDSSLEQY